MEKTKKQKKKGEKMKPLWKQPVSNLTQREKDKIFKDIYCNIVKEWQIENGTLSDHIFSMDTNILTNPKYLDLDHIKNRSTNPELKYRIDNVQLITRKANQEKKQKLLQTDFRSKEFAEWVSKKYPIRVEFI